MERFDDDEGLQGYDPVAPAAFRNQEETIRIATGNGGRKGYMPSEDAPKTGRGERHTPGNGTEQFHNP